MRARVEKTSQAAGEIAPLLRGRRDQARWQTGVDRAVNMAPTPEGPLQRRSGTRFVTPLAAEGRRGLLVEFEAAADDNCVLVMNGALMRIVKSGGFVRLPNGHPYQINQPFPDEHLERVQWAQSINQIYFAWGAGPPKVLTRNGPTDWSFADYAYVAGPVRTQNADASLTLTATGTTGAVTLTSSAFLFKPGHVGSVWRIDEANLGTIPAWKPLEAGLPIGAQRRHRGNVYEVVTPGADSGPNAPVHTEGDWSSGGGNTVWRYLNSTSGFVRITAFVSAQQVSATVLKRLPETVMTTSSARWFEAAWSDERGWPDVVAIHDGQLIWAMDNMIWATQTLDIRSFDETNPDDGAWSQRLIAPDGKRVDIQWMQAAGVLVVGTRSGVWAIRGKDAYERITQTSIRAVPMSSEGAGVAGAVTAKGGAIFVGRSRRDAYFARFDALADRVDVQDLTVYSRRILQRRAAQMADQRDPYRMVWFRTDDGELRGLTFVPDQDNLGWCRFITQGTIEQVAAIQSEDESLTEIWLIVRRTIAGQERRYVEQLQPFFVAADEDEPTAAGAWFLDCALQYKGAPATLITGLQHLEGLEVGVFADGDERPSRVVSAGAVTLDAPASDVVVGLKVAYLARFLPPEASLPSGSTAGRKRQIGRAYVELLESGGGRIGQVRRDGFPLLPRGLNQAGVPRRLHSGWVETAIDPSASASAAIEIYGDDALPLTILGVTVDQEVSP